MAQVVAGDLDKLAFLYDRYKLPLYAYFFKISGGQVQSCEDLVHTVFYRVIKHRDLYRGKGSFAGWLFAIAHNVGIDFNRKEKQTRFRHVGLNENQAVPTEISGMEKDEINALLLKALSMLPSDDREILVLSKQDCLKYKEIAEIYKCSENAIKVRVFRALKKLQEIYFRLENN